MTTAQLTYAVTHKEAVDRLLNVLSETAQAENSYEYGLPIWNEPSMAQMREIVYRWLLDLDAENAAEAP